jgi:hypothetical protein
MYTQGDGLWIKNAAEEERLVDALRKGRRRDRQGPLRQGHRDHRTTFALKGLAQALDKALRRSAAAKLFLSRTRFSVPDKCLVLPLDLSRC